MSEETEDIKKEAAEAGGVEIGGGSVPPKIDHGKRFLALLVDVVIVIVVGAVGGIVSSVLGGGMIGGIISGVSQLAAGGYLLLRDSLNDGRSVGKKMLGLTVQTPDGTPCSQEQSMKRNAIIGAPTILGGISTLVGSIPVVGLLSLLFVPLSLLASLAYIYEAIQVLTLDPNGRRMMELKSETYTVLA